MKEEALADPGVEMQWMDSSCTAWSPGQRWWRRGETIWGGAQRLGRWGALAPNSWWGWGRAEWCAGICPEMKLSVGGHLMKVSEQTLCDDAERFPKYLQFFLVRPLDTGQRKCKCVKRKSFLVQMELAGAARLSLWQPRCDLFFTDIFVFNFYFYLWGKVSSFNSNGIF